MSYDFDEEQPTDYRAAVVMLDFAGIANFMF